MVADRVTSDPTGLTIDTIQREISTLRDLLQTQVKAIEERLEAFQHNHEEKHISVVEAAIAHRTQLSDLGTSGLRSEVFGQLGEMDRRYQQRFEAQSDALNAAFSAQQTATAAALASAEKAVTTALASAEKGVQTALSSAERAVTRSETQAETRVSEIERQVDRRFLAEAADRFAALGTLAKRIDEVIAQRDLANVATAEVTNRVRENVERIQGLDRVTDAKFITFRTLIDSQADKVALALAASDKAVTKAEAANEKRFEAVNEFRSQLSDQTKTFISRVEFAAESGSLASKLEDLKANVMAFNSSVDTRLATMAGKAVGLNAGWVYLLAALGALGTVVSLFIALK